VFLVDEGIALLGIEIRDQHRNGIGDQADAAFALAQGRIDHFALLDFLGELFVERQQFHRAFADSRFQLQMVLQQIRLGLLTGGDILIDGDEPTSGNRLAANLQNRAVGADSLETMALELPGQPDAVGHLRCGITGTVFTALGVVGDHLFEL